MWANLCLAFPKPAISLVPWPCTRLRLPPRDGWMDERTDHQWSKTGGAELSTSQTPGEENGNPPLAWRIPWTGEPGGLQSTRRKEWLTLPLTSAKEMDSIRGLPRGRWTISRSCTDIQTSPSAGEAAAAKSLQSCPTLCDPVDGSPPGSRPWDSPGKNAGVGCHFLLQCMKVKRESEVAQSCLTLSDPMDCSPPGSSVHGILQARGLEWVPLPSLRA